MERHLPGEQRPALVAGQVPLHQVEEAGRGQRTGAHLVEGVRPQHGASDLVVDGADECVRAALTAVGADVPGFNWELKKRVDAPVPEERVE